MLKIMTLLAIFFAVSLCGCAAIRGAHGDAAVAKETAAAQATAKTTNVDAEANAPAVTSTPSSAAISTQAAKVIAPLH